MCIACRVIKTTDSHTKYVVLIAFLGSNALLNTPQYYINTYIACLVRIYLSTHSDFGYIKH